MEKTFEERFKVVAAALYLAGEYARKNPPAEIPSDYSYMRILAGGKLRDPHGKEYIAKWLYEAEKSLGLNE